MVRFRFDVFCYTAAASLFAAACAIAGDPFSGFAAGTASVLFALAAAACRP